MDSLSSRYSHWLTAFGIVLCAIAVIVATPLTRWLCRLSMGSWLSWPDPIDYYLADVPLELIASGLAGSAGCYFTCRWLKRANPTAVAYSVSTLYTALFILLLVVGIETGRLSDRFLLAVAQFIGTLGGLFVGRSAFTEGEPS